MLTARQLWPFGNTPRTKTHENTCSVWGETEHSQLIPLGFFFSCQRRRWFEVPPWWAAGEIRRGGCAEKELCTPLNHLYLRITLLPLNMWFIHAFW